MNFIKDFVVTSLHRRTARYIRKNSIKVIAVVGSVGKTSTSHAIRTVLKTGDIKVQESATNYNTNKSIHLQIFNLAFATNPLSWVVVIIKLYFKSLIKPNYTHIVLELGTDAPGDLAHFSWIDIDTLVITAITPEHMLNFKDLDAVADEELTLVKRSKTVIYNGASIAQAYIERIKTMHPHAVAYGVGKYSVAERLGSATLHGKTIRGLNVVGEHSLLALSAAILVGQKYKIDPDKIEHGLLAIQPVAGRMQKLHGIKDSLIIDDSYNASPDAVIAALEVLKRSSSKHKIALLGQMNELGDHSESYHRHVGKECRPTYIQLLITLGPDSNLWLADEAERNGCKVIRTTNPQEAGEVLLENIQDKSLVLVKGSQNRVFAEEAIKKILADPKDASKLTRQSPYWLQKKKEAF